MQSKSQLSTATEAKDEWYWVRSYNLVAKPEYPTWPHNTDEGKAMVAADLEEVMQLSTRYRSLTHNAGSIQYETGKQQFNYCYHEHDNFVYVHDCPFVRMKQKESSTSRWIDADVYCGSAVAPAKPPHGTLSEITEDLRKEAWQSMMPELNTGLSLTNFILELRDLSSLLRMGYKLKKLLSNLDPKLFGSLTAAELTLTYSFGIKPLEADLKELFRLWNSIDKEINKFISAGKKVQSYHFQKSVTDDDVEISTNDASSLRRKTVEMYYATCKYRYEYERPPSWEAFRRVIGLRLTPETIWNAIPFTFVIDWVVNIAQFFRQFDDDPNLKVVIVDYCDSMKRIVTNYELRHLSGKTSTGHYIVMPEKVNVDNELIVWMWHSTTYKRVPDAPNMGYAFPVLDTVSTRELVLGGALLRTLTRS